MMSLIIDPELIEEGQTVVLGLSGGPDSVCLLFELLESGIAREKIICAHVNHGLRGGESDGDEAYVVSLCQKLDVALEILRIDAAAQAKENGLTIEEAGRGARYEFFDELCEKYGEDTIIAVAHNRDDQAETVLMRILRGTGTDGLAGMAKKRKSAAGNLIVRPLLGAARGEIEKRLAEYGETAMTDGSNSDTAYFRNKLRLEAFPYIEEKLGLDLKHGLVRLSENAAEDKDYFDAVVEEALDEYLQTEGDVPCVCNTLQTQGTSPSVCLPAELLASVHPAIRHRLIRAVFREMGLEKDIAAVHLAAADSLLATFADGGEASGKRVEFPRDYTFGISGKNAVFRAPGEVLPGWKPMRKL